MSVMMCHIDKQGLIVVSQFGWGLEIDAKKLKEINESRHGKRYFNTKAATEVNGNTQKLILLSHHSVSRLNLVAIEGTGPATTRFCRLRIASIASV